MKTRTLLYMLILLTSISLFAETLQEDRKYETAVFTASEIKGFIDIPVDEIFAYSYNASDNTWTLIPFQIDEQTQGPDPLNEMNRWSYFIYPSWPDVGINDHNKVFDDHDELVFMVKDLGDYAPRSTWISDEDSKKNDRLELIIYSQANPTQSAYLYLYQSKTIDRNTIPKPYNMEYLDNTDAVKTSEYTLGFNSNGVIDDIYLHQGGTISNTDLFDVLKIRFYGRLDASIGFIPINASELFLHTDSEFYYTQNPVTRIVRQTKHTLQINNLVFDEFYFWVKTKLMPFSGSIWGGAKLDKNDFADLFPFSDAVLYPDSLRFSWDFNSNASGMNFINSYNNNILVNGQPDVVDKTINIPAEENAFLTEWGLTTGSQGSVFTFGKYEEKDWDVAELYYYDNLNGPQGNDPVPDTGDQMSYGDYGVNFKAMVGDTISLNLGFVAYFLTQQNMTRDDGLLLYQNTLDTLKVRSNLIVSVEENQSANIPDQFVLYQNYPNPFNHSTQFKFSLAKNSHAKLEIFDTTGRLVNTVLNNFSNAGTHKINWNGRNIKGKIIPTGVYFYKLTTDNHVYTRKLIMVR